MIHRDIKPDNLLLSDDEVLKIADFGVSEMFDKSDSMRVSKSAGSPAFMPPELCGKHQQVSGKAADIWSMGVTLYCLKYGKIPFNRAGVLEIYEAVKSDAPVFPEGEDADFVDLMERILEKDPERRVTMPELRVGRSLYWLYGLEHSHALFHSCVYTCVCVYVCSRTSSA